MPAEVPLQARLRRVGPQDWAAWRDLRVEALRDTPLGFVQTLEHALAQDEAAWRQRMADVPCSVLAEAGGRAVAMASGFLVEQQPFLGAVYVTPAWRGRGLLGALVDAVAQRARPLGSELLLEVHEDNARARRAYQGLGFVETGQRRPYPLDPTRDELVMVLAL